MSQNIFTLKVNLLCVVPKRKFDNILEEVHSVHPNMKSIRKMKFVASEIAFLAMLLAHNGDRIDI